MSIICEKCGGTGKIITGAEAKALREKKGLTLREVSALMGIAIAYLSDLEGERRGWSHELERKFRKATK